MRPASGRTPESLEDPIDEHLHRALTVRGCSILPLTQALHNGWFACSVAIRGSGGAERLLRLTRLFRDAPSAADHARSEGRRWVLSTAPG